MSGAKKTGAIGLARRSTMSDVAKRANVSISTVSHVLNGTASISVKASEKVISAMKELNYMPNALARGLRQKQTKVIGLIIPDIRNEFYACCASGLLQEADKENYTVLLCDCCYDLQREERSVQALIERRVDGLIFFGGADDEHLISMAEQAGVPVVLGDRSLDGCSSVVFSNMKVMRQLVKSLYDMGKRRFCYVSEPVRMQNLRERYEGFMLGVKDCGLPPSQQQIITDKALQKEKINAARTAIERQLSAPDSIPPDVYITSSDAIAIGVIAGLSNVGLHVPNDCGVVGYDNILMAAYVNPPLTTVSQDMLGLGKRTFSVLLEALLHESSEPTKLIMEPEIIFRGSVK